MKTEEYIEILQILDDGAYLVDTDRRITFWNSSAERITGFSAEEVTGSRCRDNILQHVTENGIQLCLDGCPLYSAMAEGCKSRIDVYLHHRNGHRLPVSVRAAPLKDEKGKITGGIEIFSETSEPSRLLEELEVLRNEVLLDKQTSLGNRRYFEIVQNSRLSALKRDGGTLGILFVDIDHFKKVNDTWGHSIGDKVLRMVALTIKGAVRPNDSAIRYGGEEFVVISPGSDYSALAETAERIRVLVEQTWLSEAEANVKVTVSVGGTLMIPADDFADRLARADALMYECKNSGRNRILVKP